MRLGFDDAHMTVRAHAKLVELSRGASRAGSGGRAGGEAAAPSRTRRRSSAIARAAAIADDLYGWLIAEYGLAGHTEREVARRARATGAGHGRRRALVPADRRRRRERRPAARRPRRDAEIPRDTLVVVDLGCLLDGYCSDCTRTFATGEIEAEARECYELVRSAQEAALAAIAPARTCRTWTGWRAS